MSEEVKLEEEKVEEDPINDEEDVATDEEDMPDLGETDEEDAVDDIPKEKDNKIVTTETESKVTDGELVLLEDLDIVKEFANEDAKEILSCNICSAVCTRGVNLVCCYAVACRTCATKQVAKIGKCWACAADARTDLLVNDLELRDACTALKAGQLVPGDLLNKIKGRQKKYTAQVNGDGLKEKKTDEEGGENPFFEVNEKSGKSKAKIDFESGSTKIYMAVEFLRTSVGANILQIGCLDSKTMESIIVPFSPSTKVADRYPGFYAAASSRLHISDWNAEPEFSSTKFVRETGEKLVMYRVTEGLQKLIEFLKSAVAKSTATDASKEEEKLSLVFYSRNEHKIFIQTIQELEPSMQLHFEHHLSSLVSQRYIFEDYIVQIGGALKPIKLLLKLKKRVYSTDRLAALLRKVFQERGKVKKRHFPSRPLLEVSGAPFGRTREGEWAVESSTLLHSDQSIWFNTQGLPVPAPPLEPTTEKRRSKPNRKRGRVTGVSRTSGPSPPPKLSRREGDRSLSRSGIPPPVWDPRLLPDLNPNYRGPEPSKTARHPTAMFPERDLSARSDRERSYLSVRERSLSERERSHSEREWSHSERERSYIERKLSRHGERDRIPDIERSSLTELERSSSRTEGRMWDPPRYFSHALSPTREVRDRSPDYRDARDRFSTVYNSNEGHHSLVEEEEGSSRNILSLEVQKLRLREELKNIQMEKMQEEMEELKRRVKLEERERSEQDSRRFERGRGRDSEVDCSDEELERKRRRVIQELQVLREKKLVDELDMLDKKKMASRENFLGNQQAGPGLSSVFSSPWILDQPITRGKPVDFQRQLQQSCQLEQQQLFQQQSVQLQLQQQPYGQQQFRQQQQLMQSQLLMQQQIMQQQQLQVGQHERKPHGLVAPPPPATGRSARGSRVQRSNEHSLY